MTAITTRSSTSVKPKTVGRPSRGRRWAARLAAPTAVDETLWTVRVLPWNSDVRPATRFIDTTPSRQHRLLRKVPAL